MQPDVTFMQPFVTFCNPCNPMVTNATLNVTLKVTKVALGCIKCNPKDDMGYIKGTLSATHVSYTICISVV